MSSNVWIMQDSEYSFFGDKRLDKRMTFILDHMFAKPTASIPQTFGSWAGSKGAYRFLNSEKVTPELIRKAHYLAVHSRLPRNEMILAIQDTTDLDFTAKPKTKGLGPICAKNNQGLKVHSLMAVSSTGVPLGILHQEVWARDPKTKGKGENCRKRPLDEKESKKWIIGLEKTEYTIPDTRSVLLIGDRESDMFPFFAAPRCPNTHILVRAAYDRRVTGERRSLYRTLAATPVCGSYEVTVRGENGCPAREATMSVRYAEVTLTPPNHYKGEYAPVNLTVVEAFEEIPPEGVTALHWVLLTTLALNSFEAACQCLRWYSYRWHIEQYHRTLKSGCGIEELQLKSAEAIESALALYSIVAWRLLWLTYVSREQPEAPCSLILEPHEWRALYCREHKVATPPAKPPSTKEAVRWIAKLGGFLGRRGDGSPGVQVLWRGIERLNDLAEMWKLLDFQNTCG